jgi:hypothetical protein
MVCTRDISGIIEDLLELDVRWRDGAIVTNHSDEVLDAENPVVVTYQAYGDFDQYLAITDLCEPDAEELKELKDAEVTPKEFLEYIKKDFEENGAPDPEGMSKEEILMHILVESLPIDD